MNHDFIRAVVLYFHSWREEKRTHGTTASFRIKKGHVVACGGGGAVGHADEGGREGATGGGGGAEGAAGEGAAAEQ